MSGSEHRMLVRVAAGVIALWPAAALAQTFVVVSRPHAHETQGTGQSQRFRSTMDKVFGPGAWRQTSGYRSRAREDELRREGAGTVAPGQISHHSMGTPDAPGAFDVVVPGMSTQSAAEKLRNSGEAFTRVLAEGAHGPEGSHLHIEPSFARGADPVPSAVGEDTVYLRVVGGRRNPVLNHRR